MKHAQSVESVLPPDDETAHPLTRLPMPPPSPCQPKYPSHGYVNVPPPVAKKPHVTVEPGDIPATQPRSDGQTAAENNPHVYENIKRKQANR